MLKVDHATVQRYIDAFKFSLFFFFFLSILFFLVYSETWCDHSKQKWILGASHWEKLIVGTPHFWRICHLKKQRITSDGGFFRKNFENRTSISWGYRLFLNFIDKFESSFPWWLSQAVSFTKVNKLQWTIGGGVEAPPALPLTSDVPVLYAI